MSFIDDNNLAMQDAILEAHRDKTHCKLQLFVDLDQGMRIEPLSEHQNEINELNFTKVTDNFEKVELEFDYNDDLTSQVQGSNILDVVRKQGDIGPDPSHYELDKLR